MSVVDSQLEDELADAHGAVPARAVLTRAEALRRRLGHENLGFLSEERGFVPVQEPLLRLPREFTAWDEAAARLPSSYRSLRLRRELDALPLLDAGPDGLPDEYLLRAALILGLLSQSYWYVETRPPRRLPVALERPWTQVRARLGRPQATITGVDLMYNWRVLDPHRPGELRVDNLGLLVGTVDTQAERLNYVTSVELTSQASPILAAMVRAHEAVVADDADALAAELASMLAPLEQLPRSLANIDPNPHSARHVDQVAWARTVAPLVVPLKEGDQGPSGTVLPIFSALDIFLGRKRFDSYLGREIRTACEFYPPLWRDFVEALAEVSVPHFVARSKDPTLVELLRHVLDRYAGRDGFLGYHQMKVRGYLELAFKVGRSVTITGFKGAFSDRTWDVIYGELELARRERVPEQPQSCHRVGVSRVTTYAAGTPDELADVVLDLSGLPLPFRPGDHCWVLPENTDAVVERTLTALGATGEELVEPTPEWRNAARPCRDDAEPSQDLTVRELLRYGRLRPVSELAGVPLEALGTVIPPARFRPYSISSAPDPASGELRLTVARLRYAVDGEQREGTASRFLATAAGTGNAVLVRIERAPRFQPPDDPATPLVMIAGGSGIAPFRGFVAERLRHADAGPAWLLLGLRTHADVLAADELVQARRRGVLEVQLALSRPATGPARRIGDLLQEPANVQRLRDLIGRGAHVYVCGGRGFAQAAMAALERAVSKELLDELTAQGRLRLEAFAGHDPDADLPELDWSLIAQHNDERRGQWLVLDGRVYDIENFVRRHPGGVRILRNWLGTDATAAFVRSHHGRADIDAMRELYVIGRVRPVELPVHRAWVAVLQLVVEMQNALPNDQDLQRLVTTRGDTAPRLAPYNLQRAIETHERFLRTYLDVLLDESFQNVWAVTTGSFTVPREPSWMRERIVAMREQDDARWHEGVVPDLYRMLDDLVARHADAAALAELERACRTLAELDRRLLDDVKEVLRQTVAAFEEGAVGHDAAPLPARCEQLVSTVASYHERLRRQLADQLPGRRALVAGGHEGHHWP